MHHKSESRRQIADIEETMICHEQKICRSRNLNYCETEKPPPAEIFDTFMPFINEEKVHFRAEWQAGAFRDITWRLWGVNMLRGICKTWAPALSNAPKMLENGAYGIADKHDAFRRQMVTSWRPQMIFIK